MRQPAGPAQANPGAAHACFGCSSVRNGLKTPTYHLLPPGSTSTRSLNILTSGSHGALRKVHPRVDLAVPGSTRW
jgi:hypothetical protein